MDTVSQSQAAHQQLRQVTQEMQNLVVQVEDALNAPVSQQIEQLDAIHRTIQNCYATAEQAVLSLRDCAATVQQRAYQARM